MTDHAGPHASPEVPVELRPAVEEDLVSLADIELAAGERFRDVGLPTVADDEPPPLEAYREAAEDGLLWVAIDPGDGSPVGYAWAVDLSGQPHLEQLSVHPDWQGRGIGAALLELVVDWARSVGGRSVSLATFRDVPWNGPWYRARGFEVLPESGYGERFRALRRHEASLGLDVAPRVVMVRSL